MFKGLEKYFSYNKQEYENILDDPNSKVGKFLDNFLLFLVLLFCGILIFETIGNNSVIYYKEVFIFEAGISIVFALEYFYRLYKSKKKLLFLLSPIRIIDLLSFSPFFLGYIQPGSYLKVLKIVRFLRILRIFKKNPLTSGFIASLKDYLDEFLAVFTIYFVVLFIGSTFVYSVEKDIVGTNFNSILDSLWWGIVTMATVGYGDIVPKSDAGKIIGSVLVFLGPVLGAIIGAITIMVFMDASKYVEHKKDRLKICLRCKTRNPREANYCMKCGENIGILRK